MKTQFHYRVRAIIHDDNYILLARGKDSNNTFLPGGHIELGEKAEDALIREIKEELGVDSTIQSFMGAVENSWLKYNEWHHEINLIFRLNIPGLQKINNPVSLEDHIKFLWSDADNIEKNDILPRSLIALIKSWQSGNTTPWWGSNFD
jgi:8-oxo-dGTP diphosphatase